MTTKRSAAFGAIALLGLGVGMAPNAQAAFVATMTEVGPNVVVTGSGTINLAGLSVNPSFVDGNPPSAVWPSNGTILLGPPPFTLADFYVPFSGPSSFGPGGVTVPSSSGTGDRVGIRQDINVIVVPFGYVSNSPLSTSSTYDGATFASLGVIPGTYVWTLGNGRAADSFTLDITDHVVATPEPASLALFATGLIALTLKRRREATA